MKMYICWHQVFGTCKCTYDVDKSHHPNNLECPRYKPFGFVLINLEKEGENARNESSSSKDEA